MLSDTHDMDALLLRCFMRCVYHVIVRVVQVVRMRKMYSSMSDVECELMLSLKVASASLLYFRGCEPLQPRDCRQQSCKAA